jgi:uncharacterized membrane protein
MTNRFNCTLVVLLTLLIAGLALADTPEIFTRKINRAQDRLHFPNSKGEVIFTHSRHIQSLKEHECVRCHRIENPSLENIQSRFEDHRVAHSFCRGCHREMGKGPTECHQCHNYKKTT